MTRNTAFLLLALLVATACVHRSKPSRLADIYNSDSLLTLYRQVQMHPELADSFLHYLNQFRNQGNAPYYKLVWTEANIYDQQGKYNLATRAYTSALQDDSVKQNPRLAVNLCNCIIKSFWTMHKLDSVMKYTGVLLKTIDDNRFPQTAKFDAYFYIAKVYESYGDTLQSKEMLDEAQRLAVELLDRRRKEGHYIARALYQLIDLCNLRLDCAWERNRYSEANGLADQFQGYMEELDTLVMTPNRPDGIPEAILRQQYSILCMKRALIYRALGCKEEEKEWAGRLKQLADSPDNAEHLATYLLASGQYASALPVLTDILAQSRRNNDSINPTSAHISQMLAQAYAGIADWRQAYTVQEEYTRMVDTLLQRRQKSELLEMAEINHTYEQRRKIQEQENVIGHQRTTILVLALMAITVCSVAYISICYSRSMKKRNRIMAQQIKQMQKLQKAITDRLAAVDGERKEAPLSVDEVKGKNRRTTFNELERLMKEELIFQNPKLKVADVAKQLGVSLKELNSIINEILQMNYINYLMHVRMDYAMQLLEQPDNLKLEYISQQAGFGTLRHFYRSFQDKYGMTPTAYRHAVLNNTDLQEGEGVLKDLLA
ncbi:helix-turn-helix domain-containing protein [Phocaeicola sp.]